MDQTVDLKDGRSLTCRRVTGRLPLDGVFMHGTLSDKNAATSLFLPDVCARRGLGYVAFDFIGLVESSGLYTDVTLGVCRSTSV